MAEALRPLRRQTLPTPTARAPEAVTAFIEAGAGEPVILVHGVGMEAGIWAPQIAALSRTHHVVALDMPGHGGSSRPPASPGLSDYAAGIAALMDALGMEKAAVVGHSMGALVALELALSNPGRVARLVALNAVFRRSPAERAAVEGRLAALGDRLGADAISATLGRWFGDPVPDAFAGAAATARAALESVDPEGYRATYRLFATSDAVHAERLGDLAMPALFLTGERDRNSSPAMSRAMADLAPQGRACVLPGQAHMMALTDPDGVNREIAAFLGGPASPRERDEPMPGAIDPTEFRKALGAFPTGVTVVTCATDEGPRGFTANSFTSVSLDPPLVLACIAKKAFSHDAFASAGGFAVNILSEDQRAVSSQFASRAADKFAGIAWTPGHRGNPRIEGATALFDCSMHGAVDGGDHTILIGRVEAFRNEPSRPLGYCRGAYVSFGLSQEALTRRGPMLVGAILEVCDGETGDGILLLEDGAGRFDLPTAPLLEPESDPASLAARLAGLGFSADLGFLFSVFEGRRNGAGATEVYYRGLARPAGPKAPGVRIAPLGDLGGLPLATPALATMLQRYRREREEDAFGVYVGDDVSGAVRPIPTGASSPAKALR